MAKLKMYVARDSKLDEYMAPVCFEHPGQAERWWSEICNDGKSLASKHPSDYSLLQVGEMDTSSGVVSALAAPVHFLSAVQVKEKPQPSLL